MQQVLESLETLRDAARDRQPAVALLIAVPFGVLDAQGFTLTDKGAAIQFHGPARLVLNERK